MKFQFSSEDLKVFRAEMNWTWKQLANKFGVEQRTVYFWVDKTPMRRRKIPGTAVRLVQLYRLLKSKGMNKYIKPD